MAPSRLCRLWAVAAVAEVCASANEGVFDVASQDAMDRDDACAAGAVDPACGLTLMQLRAGHVGTGKSSEVAVASAVSGDAATAAATANLEYSLWRKTAAGGGKEYTGRGHQYIDYNNIPKASGPVRNLRTLYHQTSPEAGASILRTGFRLGTWHAICGSAIYFSPSVSDTDHKAMGGRGFIIEAVVDVGNVLHAPRDCDPSMTGGKLRALGYDSITLDRGGYVECKGLASCVEYVIYDPSRVVSMKGYQYHGWKSWNSPTLVDQGSMHAADALASGATPAST